MPDEHGSVELPPEKPWARRLAHSVLLAVTLVLIWWVIGVASLYVQIYEHMEVRGFYFVTELFLKMSGIPAGMMIAGGVAGLVVIALGHFGYMDRALLPLIIAELVLDAILVYGWLVALPMSVHPIIDRVPE